MSFEDAIAQAVESYRTKQKRDSDFDNSLRLVFGECNNWIFASDTLVRKFVPVGKYSVWIGVEYHDRYTFDFLVYDDDSFESADTRGFFWPDKSNYYEEEDLTAEEIAEFLVGCVVSKYGDV